MTPIWIVFAILPLLGAAERFSCRGRILGAYYADYKSACKAFHVCVRVAGGGIRDFRFFCPPGTRFTQEAQTCTDWGDDDGLACPVDYDGQFDLYKIGSGLDAKKIVNPTRDDESEFSLQRAESNNRNLASTPQSVAPQSDLRAAHSSDFFTGRRERGRDENLQTPTQAPPSLATRAPYRRPPPRTTVQSSQTEKPYDPIPKRKTIRKRPNYIQSQKYTDFNASPSSTLTPPKSNEKNNLAYDNGNSFRISLTSDNNNYNTLNDVSRIVPKEQYSIRIKPQNENINNNQNYEQPKQDSGPFKITVRNNFVVSPGPDYASENDTPKKNVDVSPNGFNNVFTTRGISTANYNNFNSVSYDNNKQISQGKSYNTKENYYSQSPVTTPAYSTIRVTAPPTVNTIAYKTNDAFKPESNNNFADNDEDDGQYRLPPGEDDGQYRPELYEKELLSGAHSINIAASGNNRLIDDQKIRNKITNSFGQTPSSPRPFSVPTTTLRPITTQEPIRLIQQTYSTYSPLQTEYISTYPTTNYSPTFATTPRQPRPTVSTQQTYQTQKTVSTQQTYQTQKTTQNQSQYKSQKKYTTPDPYSFQDTTKTIPKSQSGKQNNKNHFSKPVNGNKEDSSYDYAYYDSDPYSEYEQIEEFSKTSKKA